MSARSASSGTEGLDAAWVLHRRPYGETSALVELFTEQAGRIGAVARGAGRRGWRGVLEPFTPLLVGWCGRGELKTLIHVEAAGAPERLQGPALACGFYLAELALRLIRRDDPHPKSWYAYGTALGRLTEGVREQALRHFELALLEEIGYGIQLERDAEGAPVDEGRRYRYLVERGPVPSVPGSTEGVDVLGETLRRLARGDELEGSSAQEARRLLRHVLHHHLGGRPLQSRELFRAFRDAPGPRTIQEPS